MRLGDLEGVRYIRNIIVVISFYAGCGDRVVIRCIFTRYTGDAQFQRFAESFGIFIAVHQAADRRRQSRIGFTVDLLLVVIHADRQVLLIVDRDDVLVSIMSDLDCTGVRRLRIAFNLQRRYSQIRADRQAAGRVFRYLYFSTVQVVVDRVFTFRCGMQRSLVVTVIAVLLRCIREGFSVFRLQILVRTQIVLDNNPYKFSREVVQRGIVHCFRSVLVHDICIGIRIGITGEVIPRQIRRYIFLSGNNRSAFIGAGGSGVDRCHLQTVPLAIVLVGITECHHVDQRFDLICFSEVNHVVAVEAILIVTILILFYTLRQEPSGQSADLISDCDYSVKRGSIVVGVTTNERDRIPVIAPVGVGRSIVCNRIELVVFRLILLLGRRILQMDLIAGFCYSGFIQIIL